MEQSESPRKSRKRRAKKRRVIRFLSRFFLGVLLLFVWAGIGVWIWFEIAIVHYPGDEISRDRIQRIFTLESPVYYDDAVTVLGVFFHEEHRSYVPYDEIPRHFVQALLAAEDKHFFSHPGFDIKGIIRALYLNLKAGRVVQGGSSITQQTAKNLFKRQQRSFKAKFVELVRALRLESHYTKEQILEWYANQFYVSGNGRGVGIAAQYFFNKEVGELTPLESAFIAGCVKAPNRYNPFMQKTEEDRAKALRRARIRTRYVLKNMVKLGHMTSATYEEEVKQEVPFNKGTIRYPVNAILDKVRARMEKPAVQKALFKAGVENIATSGIRIYTTIRKELQQEALAALRENLSILETRLTGYDREKVLERYGGILASEDHLDRDDFVFGTLKEILPQEKKPALVVTLPAGEEGLVDDEGLQAILEAYAQSLRGPWAKPQKGDVDRLLKQIMPGDPVFVRVRGRDDQGRMLLRLEQYPEVNGGVLVVQDGTIRAMVGGMDNVHFNRAMDAKRQVGSVFKPLIYLAALQLGWNNLDSLKNRWQAFYYQRQIYIPHPDHNSPHEWVSMTWAGAKSENIATVWFLYHLCDRLNRTQLKGLAAILDMARRAGESRASFVQRIRDDLGILVTRDVLLHTAFVETKEELRTDLIFQGRTDALRALDDLHYGLGIERYLRDREWNLRTLNVAALKKNERRELRVLFHNYLRLKALQEEMQRDYEALRWALEEDDSGFRTSPTLSGTKGFYSENGPYGPRIVYTSRPGEGAIPMDIFSLSSRVQGEVTLDQIMPQSEIWVGGALPSDVLDDLGTGIHRRFQGLRTQDPYSLDLLCRVQDFRVTMALRYVVRLAKTLGVLSPLDPVLSLPLGSNSVTLEDVARMYYGFVTGKIFPSEGETASEPSTFLISRIEGPDGEILYEAKPEPKRILSVEQSSLMSEILRKVVSHGTGRKAQKAIFLSGPQNEDVLKELEIQIPSLGKTGTSDEFRNSSYVGFIPGASKDGSSLTLDDGVVLAAYVGYDDNRSMKNKRIRIFGAAGALPIWIKAAQASVRYLDYEDRMDLVDLTFRPGRMLPIQWPKDMITIPVNSGSGLPQPKAKKGTSAHTYGSLLGEHLSLRRVFRPIQEGRI